MKQASNKRKNYYQVIYGSGLFKYIEEENYDDVWDELKMNPNYYMNGQLIYQEGQKLNLCGIVYKGHVKSEKIYYEGNSHMEYIYSPGEAFAFEGCLSSKHTSPLDYVSVGDSTIITLDINRIITSKYAIQLFRGLSELIANDNIRKMYRVETLSKRGLRDRILTYLRIMATINNSPTFTIPFSRNQLAEYLCVNRSALSNELSIMKRENVIDFRRNTFTLL
ncbi:MAG: Crp/Fnr family transcriptional regulator [Firmicutes bacterium]|nr:Crp/Fnr family transcriptional regulator [Bacillota bacterium]